MTHLDHLRKPPAKSRFGGPAARSDRRPEERRPIRPPLPTGIAPHLQGPVRGAYGKLELVRPRLICGGPGDQKIPACWTILEWVNRPTKGFQPIKTIRAAGWRIKWLVSSHINYARSRNALVANLLEYGVAPGDLHITLAGSDAWRHEVTCDGVFVSHVRENMYEYTGMLDAARLYEDEDIDYIYLLHDTIIPEANIKNCVLNQPAIRADFLPVREVPQFNMGLMRLGWLKKIQSWVETLDGLDKMTGIDIELERNGRKGLWSRCGMIFPFIPGTYKDLGEEDIWQSGNRRRHWYMPGCGIHKYFYPTFHNQKAIYVP